MQTDRKIVPRVVWPRSNGSTAPKVFPTEVYMCKLLENDAQPTRCDCYVIKDTRKDNPLIPAFYSEALHIQTRRSLGPLLHLSVPEGTDAPLMWVTRQVTLALCSLMARMIQGCSGYMNFDMLEKKCVMFTEAGCLEGLWAPQIPELISIIHVFTSYWRSKVVAQINSFILATLSDLLSTLGLKKPFLSPSLSGCQKNWQIKIFIQ